MTRLLFIHGAGAFVDDGPLADEMGRALVAEATMPRLPDDDMSLDAWAVPARRGLAALGPEDLVVGHSFGATVLLHVLGEGGWGARSAALLAMPDWGPEGWDVAEYAVTGTAPELPVSLHHCHDDDVVPFAHLALARRRLPSSAEVHEYPCGGHQFAGLAERVAATLVASSSAGAADPTTSSGRGSQPPRQRPGAE